MSTTDRNGDVHASDGKYAVKVNSRPNPMGTASAPPLNLDPAPWYCPHMGEHITEAEAMEPDHDGEDGYRPRPEFDVGDNAVLREFSAFAAKHGMSAEERANLAANWLKREHYYEHNVGLKRVSSAHRSAARIVLEALVKEST